MLVLDDQPRVTHRPYVRHLAGMVTLLAMLIVGRSANATIQLQTPDPKSHDRFYVGIDKAFIGDPLDWSGVGRDTGDAAWATMISESYFLSADHLHPAVSSTVRFHADNDPSGSFIDRTVLSGTKIGDTDLWVGKLSAPVDSSVNIYPIAVYPPPGYDNLEIYTMGRSTGSGATNQRLGRNIIDPGSIVFPTDTFGSMGFAYQYGFDSPGVGADESLLISGDSGGPSMTVVDGEAALIGIHWFTTPPVTPNSSGDTIVGTYVAQINAVLAADGQSVQIVPEPSSLLLLAAGGLLLLGPLSRRRWAARSVE